MLLSVRFQIDKVRIPRKFLQNTALGVFFYLMTQAKVEGSPIIEGQGVG